MTPKEKAEELFKKYEDCHPKNYDKRGRNFFTDQIKISALIAVNELIEATETVWFLDGNYWEEVKQEIINI